MRIIDCSKNSRLERTEEVIPENGAPFQIAAEHWMDVFINERPAMRVVCTPEHLDELVAGRLLTEGLIRCPEDIERIYICELGLRARATVREKVSESLSGTDNSVVATCCTDNRSFLQSGAQEIAPVRPIEWKSEWLTRIQKRMGEEEPLYGATHAVHSCYLARENEVLCCREDIGRHNALDKAVGWACIHEIDLSKCLLFTTGRMPSDMVSKAVRSGVPVLVSKTYPTDLGLRLAKEKKLTLITVRPGGSLTVWNDGAKAE